MIIMKDVIKNRVNLSSDEKKALWENGIFVYDTNVLLELYRCTKKTSDFLLHTMEILGDRVWIPKQVALEFANNRVGIILDNAIKFREEGKLSKAKNDFINICRKEINGKEQVDALSTQIQTWISNQAKKELLVSDPSDDYILDSIMKIFDGKVGKGFSDEELKKITEEGKKRYDEKIPPGYCDIKKSDREGNNNAYGDFIIWKEMISYSKEKDCDIIFVTQDKKEDWWLEINGRTIGPRYELREEFYKNSKRKIHFYTLNSYIENWNKIKETTVAQDVIEEVKSIERKNDDTELFKRLMLASFRKLFLERIRDSVNRGEGLRIGDIEKLTSYIDIIRNDQMAPKEYDMASGYLRGLIDVYNIVSGVESEVKINQLETELVNSERTRKIIEALFDNDSGIV